MSCPAISYRRPARSWRPRAMRFLLSRLSSLGDVVCSLPAAGALKKAFPECHLTWMVSPKFADVMKMCRWVDDVRTASPKFNASTWPTHDELYEAALDLQGLLKSAACIAKAKAGRKLGYHWQREGAWLF